MKEYELSWIIQDQGGKRRKRQKDNTQDSEGFNELRWTHMNKYELSNIDQDKRTNRQKGRKMRRQKDDE